MKSLFKINYVCIRIVEIVFLIVNTLVKGNIVGCQRVIKMGFKQIGSDFEHVIDDVELLMWTTVSLNTDFFTKENADRFASLGLFAFLVNCVCVLLKSLVI